MQRDNLSRNKCQQSFEFGVADWVCCRKTMRNECDIRTVLHIGWPMRVWEAPGTPYSSPLVQILSFSSSFVPGWKPPSGKFWMRYCFLWKCIRCEGKKNLGFYRVLKFHKMSLKTYFTCEREQSVCFYKYSELWWSLLSNLCSGQLPTDHLPHNCQSIVSSFGLKMLLLMYYQCCYQYICFIIGSIFRISHE